MKSWPLAGYRVQARLREACRRRPRIAQNSLVPGACLDLGVALEVSRRVAARGLHTRWLRRPCEHICQAPLRPAPAYSYNTCCRVPRRTRQGTSRKPSRQGMPTATALLCAVLAGTPPPPPPMPATWQAAGIYLLQDSGYCPHNISSAADCVAAAAALSLGQTSAFTMASPYLPNTCFLHAPNGYLYANTHPANGTVAQGSVVAGCSTTYKCLCFAASPPPPSPPPMPPLPPAPPAPPPYTPGTIRMQSGYTVMTSSTWCAAPRVTSLIAPPTRTSTSGHAARAPCHGPPARPSAHLAHACRNAVRAL